VYFFQSLNMLLTLLKYATILFPIHFFLNSLLDLKDSHVSPTYSTASLKIYIYI
jgi:hypothetical protein